MPVAGRVDDLAGQTGSRGRGGRRAASPRPVNSRASMPSAAAAATLSARSSTNDQPVEREAGAPADDLEDRRVRLGHPLDPGRRRRPRRGRGSRRWRARSGRARPTSSSGPTWRIPAAARSRHDGHGTRDLADQGGGEVGPVGAGVLEPVRVGPGDLGLGGVPVQPRVGTVVVGQEVEVVGGQEPPGLVGTRLRRPPRRTAASRSARCRGPTPAPGASAMSRNSRFCHEASRHQRRVSPPRR